MEAMIVGGSVSFGVKKQFGQANLGCNEKIALRKSMSERLRYCVRSESIGIGENDFGPLFEIASVTVKIGELDVVH